MRKTSAIHRLIFAWTLVCATAATLSRPSRASPTDFVDDARKAGTLIPNAVGFYLTRRGQAFVGGNVAELLKRNGYDLSEGGFEGFSYEAEEPIRLDSLPLRLGKHRSTLGEARDLFSRFLPGFKFDDPRPFVETGEVYYQAEIARLRLVPDAAASGALPRGKGVVGTLDLEISSFVVETGFISARDLSNAHLGELGASQVRFGTLPGSPPVKVRASVAIKLDSERDLSVSVLGVETTIEEAELDLAYDGALKLPAVEIIVNGRPFPANAAHFEKELLRKRRKLLKALQAYLDGMMADRIPGLLNGLLAGKMNASFTEVNEMDPPGHPAVLAKQPIPAADKFRWGVAPHDLRLTKNFLAAQFSAFVEDPRLRRQHPADFSVNPGPPHLGAYSPKDYDVAVAVNGHLLNRVLKMSYDRGYFSAIDPTAKGGARLVEAPRLTAAGPEGTAIVHVRVAYPVTGLQKLVVKSPLEVEMDARVRLIRLQDGGLAVRLESFDTSSIDVENRYIKVGIFKNKVIKGVRGKVRELNRELKADPKLLVDKLPLPGAFGGIPFSVKGFESDTNGYLVLYMAFEADREMKEGAR